MEVGAEMSGTIQSLRQIVHEREECDTLFNQAEGLSRSLFAGTAGGARAPVPFYTDHSVGHFERVERNLDAILFGGNTNGPSSFIPCPEEAMYLLSAAWLHDVGMLFGIFPHEDPSNCTGEGWDKCRREHERRTAQYIQTIWSTNCSWDSYEREMLSNLCLYHRRRYSLTNFDPPIIIGKRTAHHIRLRELAALLRLADAFHIDSSRVPLALRNLYLSTGMPLSSAVHWELPGLVTHVHFDHSERTIKVECSVPTEESCGTAIVSFRPVLQQFMDELQEELSSVVPDLARYPNTAFRKIDPVFHEVVALMSEPKICTLWPLLLAGAHSCSEAASILAYSLSLRLNGSDLSEDRIHETFDFALNVWPRNSLIYGLRRDVEALLPDEHRRGELLKYLTNFVSRRIDAVREVAAAARPLVGPNDVLVVHGFSSTIVTLIQEHLPNHKKVYIVQSMRNGHRSRSDEKEDNRLADEIGPAVRCYKVLGVSALPTVLRTLQTQGINIKVLIGARWVSEDGSVVAAVGNATVAINAKQIGVPVLVLAEREKLVHDEAAKEAQSAIQAVPINVRRQGRNFSKNRAYEIVPPSLDLIIKDWYDTLVLGDRVIHWAEAAGAIPLKATRVGRD
jgi:translation initiation factor 2B subunit (eIF-2B alpha/beta/delta family)